MCYNDQDLSPPALLTNVYSTCTLYTVIEVNGFILFHRAVTLIVLTAYMITHIVYSLPYKLGWSGMRNHQIVLNLIYYSFRPIYLSGNCSHLEALHRTYHVGLFKHQDELGVIYSNLYQ